MSLHKSLIDINIVAITTSGNRTSSDQIDTSTTGNAIEAGHLLGAMDINNDTWGDHLLRSNGNQIYMLNLQTLPSDGDQQLAMEHALRGSQESICTANNIITSPIFLGM